MQTSHVPKIDAVQISLCKSSQASCVLLFQATTVLHRPLVPELREAISSEAVTTHLQPVGNGRIQPRNLLDTIVEDADGEGRRNLALGKACQPRVAHFHVAGASQPTSIAG